MTTDSPSDEPTARDGSSEAEQSDGHVDGHDDGYVDGSVDGRVDRHDDGRVDGRVDGHNDGSVDGRVDRHDDGSVDGHVDSSVDVDVAVTRIRERARTVRDRELETAVSRLESRDDLAAADRAALEALADGLVDELLAMPERSLRRAAERDDEETVEAALSLFD